jgi:hypothetical protein
MRPLSLLQDTMLAVQQVDQLAAPARDKAREAIIKVLIKSPVSPPRIGEVMTKKSSRGETEAKAS